MARGEGGPCVGDPLAFFSNATGLVEQIMREVGPSFKAGLQARSGGEGIGCGIKERLLPELIRADVWAQRPGLSALLDRWTAAADT